MKQNIVALVFLVLVACDDTPTQPTRDVSGIWEGIVFQFNDIPGQANQFMSLSLYQNGALLRGSLRFGEFGPIDTLRNAELLNDQLLFDLPRETDNIVYQFKGRVADSTIKGTWNILSTVNGVKTPAYEWVVIHRATFVPYRHR